MLKLDWDKLHQMSRVEASTGVMRSDMAATIAWRKVPRWLQEDLRRNVETRSRNRVTLSL